MRLSSLICRAAVLVLGTSYLIATSLSATVTIKVPQQRPTIMSGIIVAAERDTVLVAPGVYNETINFLGKTIVVLASGGPGTTILRPADPFSPVVTFSSSEGRGAVLDGFTFTGYSLSAESPAVTMIDITNRASPIIRNCIFRNNSRVQVVSVSGGSPTFSRDLFYLNTGSPTIGIWKGGATIISCTIDRCEFGLFIMAGDCEVRNTLVTNCSNYGVHGLFSQFDYCDMWNNAPNYEGDARVGLHDISADPLYVDQSSYDYHLSFGSPCINTGDPNPYLADPDGTRGDIGYDYYTGSPTDVGDDSPLPLGFALAQNYPNPFNPNTRILFTLSYLADVRIEVFNSLGERVRTLADQPFAAGEHTVEWDGYSDSHKLSASGIYFYQMSADDFLDTKKMILLR